MNRAIVHGRDMVYLGEMTSTITDKRNGTKIACILLIMRHFISFPEATGEDW